MANTGMNPRLVVAPQNSWHPMDVLWEDDYWSMALGRWRSEDGNWRPVLAQRWNGEGGAKGNPVSRGYPTWFILPDETYELYADSEFIPAEKRQFVRNFLGLPDRKAA